MKIQYQKFLSGILLVAFIAFISYIIQLLPFPPFTLSDGSHPIESMAIGLIVGILLSNTFRLPESLTPGIKFSMSFLLSLGIVLLGFKLDIHTLFEMPITVPIVIIVASLVALFSAIIAGRLLNNDKTTSLLIGIGNAICGSSAIMAVSTSIKTATKDKVAMSITIINLLGLILIFLLPAAARILGLTNLQMGLWAGATGQAVPQAIAAGFTFSQAAGVYATVIKLTRVLQLGPYVIAIKLLNRESSQDGTKANKLKKITTFIPLFIILFIITVLMNSYIASPSLHIFNQTVKPFKLMGDASEFLLSMALVAIGLQTNLKVLIKYGGKNLVVGIISTFAAILVVLIGCMFF